MPFRRENGPFWHTRILISHLKYPISPYFHSHRPLNLCHVWAIDRSAGVDIGQGEAVTAFQSCPTFEDRSSIFNWEQKTCACRAQNKALVMFKFLEESIYKSTYLYMWRHRPFHRFHYSTTDKKIKEVLFSSDNSKSSLTMMWWWWEHAQVFSVSGPTTCWHSIPNQRDIDGISKNIALPICLLVFCIFLLGICILYFVFSYSQSARHWRH